MKYSFASSLAGLLLLATGCEIRHQQMGTEPPIKTKKGARVTLRDIGEKNIHNTWEGKSAPTLYDGGWFVRGDVLYWRADEEGLQYAAKVDLGSSSPKFSAHMQSPKVRWDPGFRVGLGFTFSHKDFWDLTAVWTHFQTEQSDHKSSQNFNLQTLEGEALIPYWGGVLLGSFADRASAKWNLAYNVYDLSLGRSYFIAKTVSVHPLIGLRGATIHQSYHAKYNALLTTSPTLSLPTSFHAENRFWGVGVHAAAELEWHCSSSFSILGQVGGSLLYADFHVKEKGRTFIGSSGPGVAATTPTSFNEHLTTGAPNLEAMVGVQWEMFFHQDRWRLAISLGYDWSQWYSQNRMTRLDAMNNQATTVVTVDHFDHENGTLTLQGANLQICWDF